MDTNRAGVVRALLHQCTFNPTPVAIKSFGSLALQIYANCNDDLSEHAPVAVGRPVGFIETWKVWWEKAGPR